VCRGLVGLMGWGCLVVTDLVGTFGGCGLSGHCVEML